MGLVLRLRVNEPVTLVLDSARLVPGSNRPLELRLVGRVGGELRTLYLEPSRGADLVAAGAVGAGSAFELDRVPLVWVVTRRNPSDGAAYCTLAPERGARAEPGRAAGTLRPVWSASPPRSLATSGSSS